MLVLARRLNESFVLPGLGVRVEVVAVKGNVVRLGIQAPPDVQVLRQELCDTACRRGAGLVRSNPDHT